MDDSERIELTASIEERVFISVVGAVVMGEAGVGNQIGRLDEGKILIVPNKDEKIC